MKLSVYKECKERLTKQLNDIKLELQMLDKMMKNTCPHPKKSIVRQTHTYDDEYGVIVSAWTEHSFTCTRCNTKTKQLAYREVPTNMKDLRKLLNEQHFSNQ